MYFKTLILINMFIFAKFIHTLTTTIAKSKVYSARTLNFIDRKRSSRKITSTRVSSEQKFNSHRTALHQLLKLLYYYKIFLNSPLCDPSGCIKIKMIFLSLNVVIEGNLTIGMYLGLSDKASVIFF